jgi:branched-chain amino acid transport system substrate-binding protein
LIAPVAAAALALATPGVTPTQITLGGTVPLSGPASAYASVGRGADAYFRYVDSKGGVFGRKIVFKYEDDQFEVPNTILLTRQLVEQDNVLAIFDSVGTEHALAVRPYLNDRKVPQLFVGSGVSKLATEHKKYPWSMGYLPSFAGEGAIYGRYIAAHQPSAHVAVLYENSDFGKDMLNGLRRGLGGKAKIVATQAYEIEDANVDSQLARLKSSGADTLMLFATPKFAIFGYVGSFRLAGTRTSTSRRCRSRRTS